MNSKNLALWAVYVAFVVTAFAVEWHSELFVFSGSMAAAKVVIWLGFIAFLLYSIYCSSQENIFRTINTMLSLHWGRQIGLDLYIGLGIFMGFIYLHEGSLLAVALWFLPTLLFANLATFVYLVIHFESIMKLLGYGA